MIPLVHARTRRVSAQSSRVSAWRVACLPAPCNLTVAKDRQSRSTADYLSHTRTQNGQIFVREFLPAFSCVSPPSLLCAPTHGPEHARRGAHSRYLK